jgi:hypothetical protein
MNLIKHKSLQFRSITNAAERELTKGLYIITLIQNNNTIGQSKLIIE